MDKPGDTFAEIAVGLTAALATLRFDIEHREHLARRFNLPEVSAAIGLEPLRRNIDLVEQARDILKNFGEVEPEMRALLARWAPAPAGAETKQAAGAGR